MFSGIIEELGTVKSLEKLGSISKLQVGVSKVAQDTQPGMSLSVNGACLTVVEGKDNWLCFELMPETLKLTNLGRLRPGDKVNLERALKANSRVDGHFVTGHIDGIGLICNKQASGGNYLIEVEASDSLLRYITLKGAVALDGISLTVSAQLDDKFSVSLIPYTIEHTTLGLKGVGETINIECDILAKYVNKFPRFNKQSANRNITSSLLQEHGFI